MQQRSAWAFADSDGQPLLPTENPNGYSFMMSWNTFLPAKNLTIRDCTVVRSESRAVFGAQVIPTPSHVLGRISPIFAPFFLVFCAFSPPRRGGSNEPQAGTQGQETVARAPKHRFAGLANSGCSERMVGVQAGWLA